MEDKKLIVKKRTETGSAAMRRIRKTGSLPSVIYSEGNVGENVLLNTHDVEELLHHHSSEQLIIKVEMEETGKGLDVFIKEVQHHPVTSELLHIDLMSVDANTVIHAEIPINLTGDCVGVKNGGLLDQLLHEIAVECLPSDLKESIDVDISNLELGAIITVSELNTNGGKFKFLVEENVGVATVTGQEEEEEDTDEDEADGQPEVITAKKEEK